jgi:catechol 2,3-dioxygenase-like lactoylglutathione lyase family enzyme
VLLGVVLVATSLAASPPAAPAPATRPAPISEVEAVVMVVADLDRSVQFFTSVLQFEKVSESEASGDALERLEGTFGAHLRQARLRLGDERLDLVEYLAPRGRPVPPDSRSNDRWFQHVAIIVADMDAAYRRLREHRVEHASTAPQRLPDWNANAAGIRAFYFKDPDGHPLEILEFPPGKGDAKWHRPAAGRLFLGIDHTAIVVADTDASLRLYRDVLGMRVAGSSENYGTEQEHLNNVFGARLRITSLRAAAGPGIEFLEYLAPSDGRAAAPDTRSNDLWSWQTRLAVQDPGAAVDRLRAAGCRLVSPGAVAMPGSDPGPGTGLLVRDPDGHALLLAAPYGRQN